MAKMNQSSKFDEISGGWEMAKRWVTTFADDAKNQINGNLEFVTNIKCQILDCSFPAANATYKFPHSLNKIPSGWIAVSMDRAAIIYKDAGSGDNTSNEVRLLSNTAGLVAKILVF